MSHPTVLAAPRHERRPRVLAVAVLVVAFMAMMAAKASATIEVQNYNDPAGDTTTFTYQLIAASDPTRVLASDILGDGGKVSFGPDPAIYGSTYTLHAVLPAGWQTIAINCENKAGATPATFTPDLASSSVTLSPHTVGADHYCAFTNRKVSGPGASPGGGGGGTSGIAPTTPGGGSSTTANTTALLRVRAGTHYASATVRIVRASTIKGTLLWKGKVVGTARLKKTKAGSYTIKVTLDKNWTKTFKRQGRKKVTLSLRVTVVGSNKAKKTFSSGVIVKI
jgi:hypothetical protein